MAQSAAERIVIDADILDSQERSLRQSSRTLSGGVSSAQATLGATSFGLLNSFLVSPINQMAQRTGELVAEAAEMSSRMAGGVAAAQTAFAECESEGSTAFTNFDAEGDA